MIFTHRHLQQDKVLSADVCIIGSGAGGSAAAYALALAGKKVVVLEAGRFLTPTDFSQREENMFPKLFYGAGGRRTKDRAIRVLHGHGVGGSTLHNINLCKRAPDELITEWDLPRFKASSFRPYMEKIERLLGVVQIEEGQVNTANQLFRRGVEKLGYRGGILHHNRQGCVGSGFCELGCAFDAKMNALRVLIPQAVRAGADVVANARAKTIEFDGRKARRVIAEILAPDAEEAQARLTVEAKVFVCSGGAIETPALLQRSGAPDPRRLIGSRLHLHPGVVAAGVFDSPVHAWQGVPQSYECTEHLSFEPGQHDKRIWLIVGSAHPAAAASLLPGMGDEHRSIMEMFPRFAPLSAMVHDVSRGTVSASGASGVTIDYRLVDADRKNLSRGLREASKILFAAGATEVIIPYVHPLRLKSIAELDAAELPIQEMDLDVVSVHPMSSVWMGRSPEDSCLDDTGRMHEADNVFVADTSVYPTSLGVPPQISTYSVGLYVADSVKQVV